MQDAISPDELRSPENKEVLNYRTALTDGFMSGLPVASELILEVHKGILPNNGGRFRQQPNAIKNFGTGETIYTPPRASQIQNLMSNLDTFLHGDGGDPLIKAIMAHYQFEAIHPFGDGNGRTGRIIFVLYLCEQGLLRWPALFLSGYLLANRDEYYKRLLAVTAESDWQGYLLFMLNGITQQATKTNELSKKALAVGRKLEDDIKNLPGNAQAHDLVEQLFWFPYITASVLASRLKIHYSTASRYIDIMHHSEILKDIGKEGRYHFYACPTILQLYQ
jgi:Fic family protein